MSVGLLRRSLANRQPPELGKQPSSAFVLFVVLVHLFLGSINVLAILFGDINHDGEAVSMDEGAKYKFSME